MKRLPIHPRPLPHEALSSWIDRLAGAYGLAPWTFMERSFGFSLPDDELNLAPPAGLLLTISERTGVSTEKLHAMTLAGYAPLLIDSVTPTEGLFETYVTQFPSLAPAEKRFSRPIFRLDQQRWLPWIAENKREQLPLCRQCVADDPVPYRRIYWCAAWMTCCPDHQEMLEPGFLPRPRREDLYAFTPRRGASQKVAALDRLTLQALTEGHTLLPHGGSIHAAVWVRALRSLIDELVRPQYTLAGFRQVIASAWQLVGLPMHDGLGMGRVFEDLPRELRERIFTVAAETMDRLLKGKFDTRPANVKHWSASTVFDPPPMAPDHDFASIPPRKPAPISSVKTATWEELWSAAVAAARRSPLEAYHLRQLMIWNLPESKIEGVNSDLRNLGIEVIETRPDT
ncbi:TniQ family protein [Rhizobium rhizogenes]